MTNQEDSYREFLDRIAFVSGPIGDVAALIGSPERETYEKALEVLKKVIEPACHAVGVRPVRSDDITRPGEITDQVIRLLRDADVVIADLSDANPNVMYELGLRHSIPALTIPLAERCDRLPFDINAIRTILFTRDELGLIEARRKLEAALRTGLDEGWDPVTATRIWLQDQVQAESLEPIRGSPVDYDDEEPGFLDVLAEGEEALPQMSSTIDVLTMLASELGGLATESAEKIRRSDAQGRGMRGRLALVTEYARALDPLAVRYDTASREFEAAVGGAAPSIDYLLRKLAEEPEQRATPEGLRFLEAFAGMGTSSEEAIDSMRSFDLAVGGTENASRQLRPKVRLLRSAIGRTIRSLETSKAWGAAASELL
jgi:hypothetical protein